MDSGAQFLLIAGFFGTIYGGVDVSLLWRGTPQPQEVTLTELGARDGTNNVHLTVTEFQFGDGMVIQYEEDGGWDAIWIPLLTPDGKWTDHPVVLHSGRITNDAELERTLQLTSVTGVVSNFKQGLGVTQQAEFAKLYPNADLRSAIAIQLNGKFPSPSIAYTALICGVIAVVAGIRRIQSQQPTGFERRAADLYRHVQVQKRR